MSGDTGFNRRQIQGLASERIFQRGEELYNSGAVSALIRRGDEISARCQGSEALPYRLWAQLKDGEVIAAYCSCPYDWEPFCKHIVAMLLTYLHQPQAFEPRLALRDQLMSREKMDLVDIIEEMIARHSDLEDIVERADVSVSQNRVIDLKAIRHELKEALTFRGEWMDRVAENKVYELTRLGERYASRGDYAHAIAIYCAILEECNENNHPTDDEGQYVEAVNHTVSRLSEALSHFDIAQHESLRRRLLDALADAVIWDISFGGIGYGDDADDILLEIVQPADTPLIRERIRLAEADKKERGYYSDWTGEAFEYFLLALDKIDATDPEETLKRLQAKELHYLYASVLLMLKRYEQAAGIIAELKPVYELRRGLDLLVGHQQSQTAMQLAEAALESDYDARIADWLIDLYRNQGDVNAEFRWQLNRMRRDSHINNYISLRAAAEAVGRWRSTRPQIISELKKNEEYEALVLAYLHDEEWDLAWQTLGEVSQRQQRHPSRAIYRLDFTVAEKSRQARPRLAIPIYVKYARAEIALRNRKYYAAAAELLGEVREMYRQMNDTASWQKLIDDLREEFARLPALQDELNKASL